MEIYCDYCLMEKDLDEVTHNEQDKKVICDDCKPMRGGS